MRQGFAAVAIVAAFIVFSPVGDTLSRSMDIPVGKPDPQPEVLSAPTAVFALPGDEAIFDSVVAMYESAGLEVPVFHAEFHDNTEPCHGHWGLHTRMTDGTDIIHVCFTDDRELFQEAQRTRTLMHEVAHVWVEGHLDDAGKDAFMAVRGLTAWAEGEWAERGAEHAAEILLWGLVDDYFMNVKIDDSDATELSAAFSILMDADQA